MERKADTSATTVNEYVYKILKQDILSLEIRGNERIREAVLAEKYDVSRTPVRKAIEQLVDEGFIVVKDEKTYTYLPSPNDIYNLLVLQGEMSIFAMIQTSKKIDAKKMERLYLLAHRADSAIISCNMNKPALAELDFHDYLIECSENPFLIFLKKKMADKFLLTLNVVYYGYDHRHLDEKFLPSSHRLICNNLKEYMKTGNLRPLELAVEHHASFTYPKNYSTLTGFGKTSTEVVKMDDFFLSKTSNGLAMKFSDEGSVFDILQNENPFLQKNKYVYDYLLRQIILGRMKANDRLSITDIATKLSISRTPVRDAVVKLADEGFLLKTDKNVISIKSFSEDEIDNIFYARLALESAASALAAKFSTAEELHAIKQAHFNFTKAAKQPDPFMCIIYDSAFHTAIINACHNQFLIDAYQLIYPYIRIWVWQASKIKNHNPSIWKNVQKDHESIVDCLNRRDSVGAKITMKQHMTNLVNDSRYP